MKSLRAAVTSAALLGNAILACSSFSGDPDQVIDAGGDATTGSDAGTGTDSPTLTDGGSPGGSVLFTDSFGTGMPCAPWQAFHGISLTANDDGNEKAGSCLVCNGGNAKRAFSMTKVGTYTIAYAAKQPDKVARVKVAFGFQFDPDQPGIQQAGEGPIVPENRWALQSFTFVTKHDAVSAVATVELLELAANPGCILFDDLSVTYTPP